MNDEEFLLLLLLLNQFLELFDLGELFGSSSIGTFSVLLSLSSLSIGHRVFVIFEGSELVNNDLLLILLLLVDSLSSRLGRA